MDEPLDQHAAAGPEEPAAIVDEPQPSRITALLNSTSLLSTTALMAAIEPKIPQLIRD